MNYSVPPGLLSLAAYVSEDCLVCHYWEARPLVLQTLYASVQRNTRAKKWEWVGRGVGGWVGELVGEGQGGLLG